MLALQCHKVFFDKTFNPEDKNNMVMIADLQSVMNRSLIHMFYVYNDYNISNLNKMDLYMEGESY